MSRFTETARNEDFDLPKMRPRSFTIGAMLVSFPIDPVVRVSETSAIAVIDQTHSDRLDGLCVS